MNNFNITKMKTKVLLTLALSAVLTLTSFGQEKEKRLGFEFSGGPSLATREIYNSKLEKGFGFEGIFHYRFFQHTGVYAGWGWNRFSGKSPFSGSNTDFEETGYVIGLQFKHPVDGLLSSYYLRAGFLYNHIEVENNNGEIIGDTGHGPGFQFAAGVDIPLGSKWSLIPGVKYNAISGTTDIEEVPFSMNYHYLSVRIVFLRHF